MTNNLKEKIQQFKKDEDGTVFSLIIRTYRIAGSFEKTTEKPFIILLIILPLILTLLLNISSSTKNLFIHFLEFFNNIELYLVSLTFSGYAIFQSLMGKRLTHILMSNDEKEVSTLKFVNQHFFFSIFYYICMIGLNYLFIYILKNNYLIKIIIEWNCMKVLFPGIQAIIFLLHIFSLIQIVCITYNLYHIFNVNAIANIEELIIKENSKKDGDDIAN